MDVTPNTYPSKMRDLRTDSGDIDYAAYDRLARKERAAAFALVGRWFARMARTLVERTAALLEDSRRSAVTH